MSRYQRSSGNSRGIFCSGGCESLRDDVFPAVLQNVLVPHGGRTGPEKRPLEADFPRIFEIAEDEFLEDESSIFPRGEIRHAVEIGDVYGVGVTGRFIGALGDVHHEQQQIHRVHGLPITAGIRRHLKEADALLPGGDFRGDLEVLEVPAKPLPRGDRGLLR